MLSHFGGEPELYNSVVHVTGFRKVPAGHLLTCSQCINFAGSSLMRVTFNWLPSTLCLDHNENIKLFIFKW